MVYAEPETLREMEAKSKEYLESRNNLILITLSRNTSVEEEKGGKGTS